MHVVRLPLIQLDFAGLDVSFFVDMDQYASTMLILDEGYIFANFSKFSLNVRISQTKSPSVRYVSLLPRYIFYDVIDMIKRHFDFIALNILLLSSHKHMFYSMLHSHIVPQLNACKS